MLKLFFGPFQPLFDAERGNGKRIKSIWQSSGSTLHRSDRVVDAYTD